MKIERTTEWPEVFYDLSDVPAETLVMFVIGVEQILKDSHLAEKWRDVGMDFLLDYREYQRNEK